MNEASRKDLVLAIPQIVRLLWRILRDDRVPMIVRAGLVAIVGYLALPFDIIPDWLPVLGQVDDVVVLTVGVRTLLRRVPQDVLDEHWSGEKNILEALLGRPLRNASGNSA